MNTAKKIKPRFIHHHNRWPIERYNTAYRKYLNCSKIKLKFKKNNKIISSLAYKTRQPWNRITVLIQRPCSVCSIYEEHLAISRHRYHHDHHGDSRPHCHGSKNLYFRYQNCWKHGRVYHCNPQKLKLVESFALREEKPIQSSTFHTSTRIRVLNKIYFKPNYFCEYIYICMHMCMRYFFRMISKRKINRTSSETGKSNFCMEWNVLKCTLSNYSKSSK